MGWGHAGAPVCVFVMCVCVATCAAAASHRTWRAVSDRWEMVCTASASSAMSDVVNVYVYVSARSLYSLDVQEAGLLIGCNGSSLIGVWKELRCAHAIIDDVPLTAPVFA